MNDETEETKEEREGNEGKKEDVDSDKKPERHCVELCIVCWTGVYWRAQGPRRFW